MESAFKTFTKFNKEKMTIGHYFTYCALNSVYKVFTFMIKKRETDQKRAIKKMQEQDDNMTEIANAIFSDMLTENPDQAISQFGPNRVVPDRWKGMSPEQLEQIRKEQMRQVAEKQVNIEEVILGVITFILVFKSSSFSFSTFKATTRNGKTRKRRVRQATYHRGQGGHHSRASTRAQRKRTRSTTARREQASRLRTKISPGLLEESGVHQSTHSCLFHAIQYVNALIST